jgi:predicted Rossmann-fold nucleotide-binding protein
MEAVQPLVEAGRFSPTTLYNGAEYCWISAQETVNELEICPHGGFAYIFKQGTTGVQPATDTCVDALAVRMRVVEQFEQFDSNGDGIVSCDEMACIMNSLGGAHFSDEALHEMLQAADGNDDGFVQYAEFVDWVFARSDDALEDVPVEVEPFCAKREASKIRATTANLPRMCVLGGRRFGDERSATFVKEMTAAIAEKYKDKMVVITGGLQGIQQAFVDGLGGNAPETVHVLPIGDSSGFAHGRDQHAGKDMNERMQIFAEVGEIYLTIEGGPGVAKEATQAFKRGAVVLPAIWTGGASSGMFDFPAEADLKAALEKNGAYSEADWAALKGTAAKDDADLVSSSAAAAVNILGQLLDSVNVEG